MRYLVGLVMLILIAIVAMILLLSGDNEKSTGPTPTPRPVLTEYIDGESRVSVLIDGKINSEDAHRAIRMSVTATTRTVEVLKGYDGEVEKTQSFPNTLEAYDAFMRSISNAGFMTPLKDAKQTDERGVCPTGKRYIYTLSDATSEVSRLWGTSCGAKIGNFGGNGQLIRTLFEAQIPEYNKFVTGVQL